LKFSGSRILSVAAVSLMGAWLCSPAYAQQQGAQPPAAPTGPNRVIVNMAVLDIVSLRQSAKVFKSLREQVGKIGQTFQTDLQKEQQALQTSQQELDRQRTILAPDAFARERDKWQQQYQALGRKVEQLNQEMVKIEGEANREVENSLKKIVEQIAEEYQLALIFRKETTVLSANQLDLTPMVIERLDKAMPTVKVGKPNLNAPAAQGAPAKPPAPAARNTAPAKPPANQAPAKPPAGNTGK
jgi:outer membrane protein